MVSCEPRARSRLRLQRDARSGCPRACETSEPQEAEGLRERWYRREANESQQAGKVRRSLRSGDWREEELLDA